MMRKITDAIIQISIRSQATAWRRFWFSLSLFLIIVVPFTIVTIFVHKEISFSPESAKFTFYISLLLTVLYLTLAYIVVRTIRTIIEHSQKEEAIIESLGDGLIVLDQKGMIVKVNKALCEMIGRPKEELIYRPVEVVIHARNGTNQPIRKNKLPCKIAIRSGHSCTTTVADPIYLVRPDGTQFPAAIISTPIKIANRIVGAVSSIRDITQERKIDQAKNEFVSLASHQLQAPITAAKWSAELLLDGTSGRLNATQHDQAQTIEDSLNRMNELVRSLLNVSRIDLGTFAVEPEIVNLRNLADQLISEFSSSLKRRSIHLEKIYRGALGKLKLDPKMIRIILQNLIDNAIKYSPGGAHIALRIEHQPKALVITVSDSGLGIPAKQQPRIFEKLFRAENVVTREIGGTGLGLYVVKAIVEEAGGKIWFESEENVGTAFHVKFPGAQMKAKKGSKGLS